MNAILWTFIHMFYGNILCKRQFRNFERFYFRPWLIAACAAASLAIGTRKGEQET